MAPGLKITWLDDRLVPPQRPECSCQGPNEKRRDHRRRLRNKTTANMAFMRGEQYTRYNEHNKIEKVLRGTKLLRHPDPLIQGLSNPFGTKYFNDAGVANAEKAYGSGPKAKGYGITLKKILGAGGYGIAALVKHKDEKGKVTECVMKLEKSRPHVHDTLAQEEKALTRFKGAKHILQLLDITRFIKAKRDGDYRQHMASAENDRKRGSKPNHENQDKDWSLDNFQNQPICNFVLVEHASRGDLHLWLSKASRCGTRWPQKAIWLLFKCLISGLVGMGYPPRVHHKAAHPEWDPNEPINEYIPRHECDPEQTIHFDLDPRNVLVGNDKEHGNMPIFKIADFGCAQFFSELATKPEYFTKEFFWKCRLRGKNAYYTPEQFTGEWDGMTDFVINNKVNAFVAKDGTKPSVAGNYGMHSNIYQVGVIIWCAITMCAFSPPVVPMTYPDFTGPGITTYGGALQHESFNGIDPELRNLVQLCMAHKPSDRPTLNELMSRIDARLRADDLESGEEVARWAQEFFSTPRTPGDVDPKLKRSRSDEDDEDDEGDSARHSPKQKTQGEPLLHDRFRAPTEPAAGFLPRHPSMEQAARNLLPPIPRYDSSVYLEARASQRPPAPPSEMIFEAFKDADPDYSVPFNRPQWGIPGTVMPSRGAPPSDSGHLQFPQQREQQQQEQPPPRK